MQKYAPPKWVSTLANSTQRMPRIPNSVEYLSKRNESFYQTFTEITQPQSLLKPNLVLCGDLMDAWASPEMSTIPFLTFYDLLG